MRIEIGQMYLLLSSENFYKDYKYRSVYETSNIYKKTF